jgi:transcriptional regulator with XRE-family HTH domain
MSLSTNQLMSVDQSPAWARRHLRAELRRLRDAAKQTQKDAGDALDWSQAKIMRIEKGHVRVDRGDLELLLRQYKVTNAALREDLLQLQRRGKTANPLTMKYRSILSQQFRDFLEEEEAAKIIRHFEPLVVPGALQTEEYARAAISVFATFDQPGPRDTKAAAERKRAENARLLQLLTEARMARKHVLDPGRGVRAFFLLDQSVLTRQVGAEAAEAGEAGGPGVMVRQLQYLKEVNRSEHVSIQVLPAAAGLYSNAMRSPFVVLEFDDDEMLLFQESASGDSSLREDSVIVTELRDNFQMMEGKASTKAEFDDIVDAALAQLS